MALQSDRQIKEITYRCTKCKAIQVLRHSPDETPTNPFPCNAPGCKAGMGIPFNQPLTAGMVPIESELVLA